MQTHEVPHLVKTFKHVGRAITWIRSGFLPAGGGGSFSRPLCHLSAGLWGPSGFSPLTLVSHQVPGVAWDVLDEMRQSAGRGHPIEVRGDEWSGCKVACLLPADHRARDITGGFAVSRRWGGGWGGGVDVGHCGVTELLSGQQVNVWAAALLLNADVLRVAPPLNASATLIPLAAALCPVRLHHAGVHHAQPPRHGTGCAFC